MTRPLSQEDAAALLASLPLDPDPLVPDELYEPLRDAPRRRTLQRVHVLLAGLLGVGLGFFIASATQATAPASMGPLIFIPVRLPAAATMQPTPSDSVVAQSAEQRHAPDHHRAAQVAGSNPAHGVTDGASTPGPILEPNLATLAPRPDVPAPTGELRVVTKATPVPQPPSGAGTASGTASWYCSASSACTKGYPASGAYAAAGPALRIGDWRGRVVTVCATRCTVVTLIDWCLCGGGRVVDLYSSAFDDIAPLSAGVVSVRVTW